MEKERPVIKDLWLKKVEDEVMVGTWYRTVGDAGC